MERFIYEQIKSSIEPKEIMLKDSSYSLKIKEIANLIVDAFKSGNKIILCGNGGSAADAQHIAAELVGRFRLERAPLPAIALNANTSTLTALGNDYGYVDVYDKQVQAFGKTGDVFIGISTSGNSANINKTFITAKSLGIKTVSLTGKDGGVDKNISDITLIVPSNDTPRIQESHILIGHIVCDIVERELFGDGFKK